MEFSIRAKERTSSGSEVWLGTVFWSTGTVSIPLIYVASNSNRHRVCSSQYEGGQFFTHYWWASEASETLLGLTNGNQRYILYTFMYMVCETTLLVSSRCYIMWVELSVGHYKNVVTTGDGHFKMEPCALVWV